VQLDATTKVGEATQFKYSEAYIPPEFMQLLLITRVDGRPQQGHPTVVATASFDIWVRISYIF
jgi:hypothetical protein